MYYEKSKLIYTAQANEYDKQLQINHKRVWDYYTKVLKVEPDEDGCIPIVISFDATYEKRTRLRNSLFASAFIVEAHLGLVISGALEAKCFPCAKDGNLDFDSCPHASADFHGASGNMEGVLAKKL